jgi:L-threonine-O-3-phosphate decarboxylase
VGERVLVLGGARSGKSAVAESLVAGLPVVYVATGTAQDAEVAERIAVHRAARPPSWTTVETCDLPAALASAPPGAAVLIDALGPWLADRLTAHALWAQPDVTVTPLGTDGRAAVDAVVAEAEAFWAAAAGRGGLVVLVADESGLGITPADPSTRRWLDVAGAVLQRLAAHADRVLLVVAGRPLELPAPAPVAEPAADGDRMVPPGALYGEGPPPHLRAVLDGAPVPEPAAHGDRMVPPGALDFAVNVHGEGPPPHLRAVLDKALDDAGRYPDPAAATRAAAARHGRDPSDVLVTAGAAEAFRLLPAALVLRRAVVVAPSFTEPEAALRAAGVQVSYARRDPEHGWALDPRAVPAEADLVVLGNPNNPTGTLDDPERIAALCRPGRVTVVDEAFLDFVPDPAAGLAGRTDLPGLVVVRSVTKLWGVPGLRAGYVLAPPGIIRRMAAVRQPWPVGVEALAAVTACCDDEAYRRDVAATVAGRRARLSARLASLPGLRVWPSAANFLLVAVPDGPAVHAALLERGIAVRPSTFPHLSPDHLRVAVRDDPANDLLVTALGEALS